MTTSSKPHDKAGSKAARLSRGSPSANIAAGYLRAAALDAGCEARGPIEVAPGVWAMTRSGSTRVELWHRAPDAVEIRNALSGVSSAGARSLVVARAPRSAPVKITAERARVGRLFREGN